MRQEGEWVRIRETETRFLTLHGGYRFSVENIRFSVENIRFSMLSRAPWMRVLDSVRLEWGGGD
jgi:hypothetical protein